MLFGSDRRPTVLLVGGQLVVLRYCTTAVERLELINVGNGNGHVFLDHQVGVDFV